MKNRIFIALLLSTMTVSAFAQQSNSSSSAQPAASANQNASSQSATANDKERLQPAPSQDFWDGDEPSFGALILHPFASKEYVRRHVEPIRDRLNELEEVRESNGKMISDIDPRAQQGIQMVSDKDKLADQHATEAAGKAQAAQQVASAVNTRVGTDETVVGNIDQYKVGAQTEIHFRPGQTVLSKEAKNALDEMAAPLKNQRGYILEVQGFSSGQGRAAIANSRRMADSVVRYLVLNHEIPAYRISVIGLGSTAASKGASRTRVEVHVLKNDIEQLAKQ
jgi:outer membrane protein OmpA-like peptidoglycan-associated protein